MMERNNPTLFVFITPVRSHKYKFMAMDDVHHFRGGGQTPRDAQCNYLLQLIDHYDKFIPNIQWVIDNAYVK